VLRRRLVFATPFVIVACRHPPPVLPEEAEHDDNDEERQSGGDPPDPIPIDAAVADANEPDAAVDAPIAERRPTRPERLPPGEMTTGNPPGQLRVRVVKTEVTGADLVLTIAVPEALGVRPDLFQRSTLVDDSDAPVRGGEVKLVRCGRTTCVGIVKLSYEQVRRYPFVILR
jgi:hypothetical protein